MKQHDVYITTRQSYLYSILCNNHLFRRMEDRLPCEEDRMEDRMEDRLSQYFGVSIKE